MDEKQPLRFDASLVARILPNVTGLHQFVEEVKEACRKAKLPVRKVLMVVDHKNNRYLEYYSGRAEPLSTRLNEAPSEVMVRLEEHIKKTEGRPGLGDRPHDYHPNGDAYAAEQDLVDYPSQDAYLDRYRTQLENVSQGVWRGGELRIRHTIEIDGAAVFPEKMVYLEDGFRHHPDIKTKSRKRAPAEKRAAKVQDKAPEPSKGTKMVGSDKNRDKGKGKETEASAQSMAKARTIDDQTFAAILEKRSNIQSPSEGSSFTVGFELYPALDDSRRTQRLWQKCYSMIKVYLESAGLDLLMRETKTPRGQYLEFHFANRPTIPRTRYNFRRLMAEMPAQYSAAPRKMVEIARVVVEGYFEKNRVKELVEGQPGRYSEAEVRDQDESYGRWAEGKDKTPVDEDEEGNAASDTESDAGSEDSSTSLNANIGGFGAIRSLERNDSATMRA